MACAFVKKHIRMNHCSLYACMLFPKSITNSRLTLKCNLTFTEGSERVWHRLAEESISAEIGSQKHASMQYFLDRNRHIIYSSSIYPCGTHWDSRCLLQGWPGFKKATRLLLIWFMWNDVWFPIASNSVFFYSNGQELGLVIHWLTLVYSIDWLLPSNRNGFPLQLCTDTSEWGCLAIDLVQNPEPLLTLRSQGPRKSKLVGHYQVSKIDDGVSE